MSHRRTNPMHNKGGPVPALRPEEQTVSDLGIAWTDEGERVLGLEQRRVGGGSGGVRGAGPPHRRHHERHGG